MKINWQTKKLGEICDFFNGKAHEKFINENGSYIVVNSKFISSDGRICKKTKKQLFPLFCGDIVMVMSDVPKGKSLMKGFLVDVDNLYSLNQRICAIRSKSFDKKYLYYQLNRNKYFLEFDNGENQTNLRKDDILNCPLLVPPLPEQRRIVKILDEVFEKTAKAKENAEKNLQNAKELFESYLQGVFAKRGKDWEDKKLGEVLQKTETVNPLNSPNKEFFYIDVSSVNKENLSIENATLIKGKGAPSRARKLIRTGDVIFATVRPTLRRIAVIPEEFNEQVCSTGYFVLRAKENLVNKLVFYFIQTKSFNEKMEKLQKGASYPAVTDSDVKNQIISFPKSLPEQKSIIKKLDELSAETKKLEAIYKQKLADLEELRKSVLKKAFSGKL